jgi:hypothetical protein
MKKTLVAGLFFLLCIIHLSAQDQNSEEQAIQDSEGQTASFPKFISYQPFVRGRLADGTLLKYKELKETISIVPENEKLMRRAKGWRIAEWVNAAVMIGCFGGYIYYSLNEDAPNADGKMSALSSFVNLFFITGLIFNSLEEKNITDAVYNYNLSIMGIPIPVK